MFLSKLINKLFKPKSKSINTHPLITPPVKRNEYGIPGHSYHHMPNKPKK